MEPAEGVFPALGGARLAGVVGLHADVTAGLTRERLDVRQRERRQLSTAPRTVWFHC